MSAEVMAAGRLALDWWHILPIHYMEWTVPGYIREYGHPVMRDNVVTFRCEPGPAYGSPDTVEFTVPRGMPLEIALAWIAYQRLASPMGRWNGRWLAKVDIPWLEPGEPSNASDHWFPGLAAAHEPDPRNLRDAFERDATDWEVAA